MQVQVAFKDSTVATWISVIVTLGLTGGVAYGMHVGFNAAEMIGGWWGLVQVPATIVAIIAVGGGGLAVIDPALQAVANKGTSVLELADGVVRNVDDGVAVDLDEAHVATISTTGESARLLIAGPDSQRKIRLRLDGYPRASVLEHVSDAVFVRQATGAAAMVASTLENEAGPGRKRHLAEGFNLEAGYREHVRIFEALLDAIEAHKSHNRAYQMHARFPWHHRPDPDIETVRRLEPDDPEDARRKAAFKEEAVVAHEPFVWVGRDRVMLCEVTESDVFVDMVTLASRDPNTLGDVYLMALDAVSVTLEIRTTAGTSPDMRMHYTVLAVSAPTGDGGRKTVEIPVPGPTRDFEEDGLFFQSLHRFLDQSFRQSR